MQHSKEATTYSIAYRKLQRSKAASLRLITFFRSAKSNLFTIKYVLTIIHRNTFYSQ